MSPFGPKGAPIRTAKNKKSEALAEICVFFLRGEGVYVGRCPSKEAAAFQERLGAEVPSGGIVWAASR